MRNSQENICVGVLFLIKLQVWCMQFNEKRGSITDVKRTHFLLRLIVHIKDFQKIHSQVQQWWPCISWYSRTDYAKKLRLFQLTSRDTTNETWSNIKEGASKYFQLYHSATKKKYTYVWMNGYTRKTKVINIQTLNTISLCIWDEKSRKVKLKTNGKKKRN